MRALTVLVALLLAAPAAAETTAAIEQHVRDFYAAWTSGDAAATAELWISTKRDAVLARASRTAMTRCQQVHELRILGAAVDGDTATVHADVRLTRQSAMPGSALEADHVRETFSFQRERGEWKITGRLTAEEELADRLIATTDRDALLRNCGDLRNRRLADALCKRAVTLSNRQDSARGEALLALAKTIANELDDPAARANVLSTESVLLRAAPRHEFAASVSIGEEAVAWAERSGDPDMLARALMRLGRSYYETRNNAGAAAAFDGALEIADFVEDASVLAHAASQRARVFDYASGLRDGLLYARLAASYAAMSGDPTATLNAELNLIGSYSIRSDAQQSLAHARTALAIAEQEGYRDAQAGILGEIAVMELGLGRPERFLERTSRALALLGDQGDADGRVDLRNKRAQYWLARGDLAAAEAEIELGRPAIAQKPNGDSVRPFIATWAWLRIEQGRYDEAGRMLEGLSGDWQTLGLHADLLEAQGRSVEARCRLEQAVRDVEDVRLELDSPLHRGFFLPHRIYSLLVENLVRAGEDRQALFVAERMKARVLKDLLATTVSMPGDGPEAKRLTARVVDLNRRLLRIRRDGGNASAVEEELRIARGELDEVMAFRVAKQPLPVIFDPERVVLPASTTVIEYVTSSHRTTAFVLRTEGAKTRLEAHTIPIDSGALNALTEELVHAIESRDARYRPAARRLYDLLLAPLIGAQPAGGSLCIIPDRQLGRIPFQALVTPRGEHVVERTAVFYAPSLALLTATKGPRRPDHPPTVLALGDPALDLATRHQVYSIHRGAMLGRLPDAGYEVEQLRRIYGARATAHTGAVAAESTLKRDAGGYDVLHFATHGILDTSSPMYSALLLAGSANEDGLLEAREILSLPLRAELVVLSACDSADGTNMDGEGLVGLSWAFLGAGCPRTVATQWRVGSASAARLMIAFHRRMARQRRVANVAHSLRGAQLEMLRDPRYAHPYYWAGFVLVGRDN